MMPIWHNEPDYFAIGAVFVVFGGYIAWAKRKNDPWRDEYGRKKRIGLIRHRGRISNGIAFVFFRLKITFGWLKRNPDLTVIS